MPKWSSRAVNSSFFVEMTWPKIRASKYIWESPVSDITCDLRGSHDITSFILDFTSPATVACDPMLNADAVSINVSFIGVISSVF